MNHIEKTLIEKRLLCLKGKPLTQIHRVATMGCFSFGNLAEVELPLRSNGELIGTQVEKRYQYALHLQTPFRLRFGDRVIIGESDIYQPLSENADDPDFDWDLFDYDIIDNNHFDEFTNQFNNDADRGFIVKDICVKITGDLKIRFENSFFLEVFINMGTNDECWRFFTSGDLNSHLVVSADGIMDDRSYADE